MHLNHGKDYVYRSVPATKNFFLIRYIAFLAGTVRTLPQLMPVFLCRFKSLHRIDNVNFLKRRRSYVPKRHCSIVVISIPP